MIKSDKLAVVFTAIVIVVSVFWAGHITGHRHDCQMRGFDRYDVEKQTCARDSATTEYEVRPVEKVQP